MKVITESTVVYTAPYAIDNHLNRWGEFNELVCVSCREGKKRFFLGHTKKKALKPLNPSDTRLALENFFYNAASN